MKNRLAVIFGALILILALGMLAAWPSFSGKDRVNASPDVFASPVHAGCYIAGPSDCRIHVEPFTIYISTGSKLVFFRLVAVSSLGPNTTIYDFRPDLSSPVPPSGTTYTPSLVTQDFAATCGKSYAISLQGQDTLDSGPFNLGLTGYFTCPSGMP
jgi:hypothetical protein